MKNIFLLIIILLAVAASYAEDMPKGKEYTNSIGLKLVRIEPGEFMMGFEGTELAEELTRKPGPRELPVKSVLSNIYRPTKIPTGNDWIWEQQTSDAEASTVGPLKIQTKSRGSLRFRTTVSHDFANIKWGKGFTAEARVQIIKSRPNGRGLDLEFFNGGISRYTITITDRGVYWYEGLIVGTEGLDFNEYTPLVEGVDNTDGMHIYRLAVRDDRTVQIYRDDKLIGVRRGENRTPREPYLQFGAGAELEALIEYFAYDIEGPLKPAI